MQKRKKGLFTFFGGLAAVGVVGAILLVVFLFLLPVKVHFYDSNNVIKTVTVSRSEKLASGKVPTPVKEGYKFDGWYKDASLNEEADLKKTVTKDTKYYAKFTPKDMTVRIFCNDGTSNFYTIPGVYNYLINLYDENNESYEVLTDSIQNRPNYELIGFKTDLRSSKVYGLDEQVVLKGNTVFYAVWEGIGKTVSFDFFDALLGGESISKDSVPVNYGEGYLVDLSEFQNVVNKDTGASVKGLIIDGDPSGTVYKNGQFITITSDVKLRLAYLSDSEDLQIEVDYNSNQGRKVISLGDTLDAPDASKKPHHTFLGYYTVNYTYDKILEDEITLLQPGTVVNNVSVYTIYYAIWKPADVEVVFNINTEAVGADGETENQETYYGALIALNENEFTVPNYKFAGWAFTADATAADLVANAGATVLFVSDSVMDLTQEGVLNLYAVWTRQTTTIIYHYNDNSGRSLSSEVDINQQTTLASRFSRDNYDFLHWNTKHTGDGVAYAADYPEFDVGDEPINLYAIWKGVDQKIEFNTSGAVGAVTIGPEYVEYNTYFEVDLTPYSLVQNAQGAYIKGFTVGGSGTVYRHGSKILITSPITLHLVFYGSEEMAVVYYNNDTNDIQEYSQGLESSIEFYTPNPGKSWHTFMGFYTEDADYRDFVENDQRLYQPGQIILEGAVTGQEVFYGIWSPNEITINYSSNGKTVVGTPGGMTEMPLFGDTIVLLPGSDYIAVGYTFKGWSLDSGSPDATIGATLIINSDAMAYGSGDTLTIYAIWEIKNIEVIFDYNGGSGSLTSQDFQEGYSGVIAATYFTAVLANYTPAGWSSDIRGNIEGSIYVSASNRQFYLDPAKLNNATTITLYMIWAPQNKNITFNTTNARKGGSTFTISQTTAAYKTSFTINFSQFQNMGNYNVDRYPDRALMKGLVIRGGDGTIYHAGNNVVAEVLDNITFDIVYHTDFECVYVDYKIPGIRDNIYPYNVYSRNGYLYSYYYADAQFTFASKTHDHYTLLGYSTTEGGPVMFNVGATTSAQAGTRFYAVWQAKTITVNLELFAYNSIVSSKTMAPITVLAGETFLTPEHGFSDVVFPFDFWTFDGLIGRLFYTSFEELELIQMSDRFLFDYATGTTTITLYAVFRNEEEAVFELSSDQTGGYYPIEYLIVRVGESQLLPTLTPEPGYEKLTFAGWECHDESYGEIFEFEGELYIHALRANTEGTVPITVKWDLAPTRITFINEFDMGQYTEREFSAEEMISLPDHDELGWGRYGDDELGIYAWRDWQGYENIYPVGSNWWHEIYSNPDGFIVGWEDITLYAAWATPLEYFSATEDWVNSEGFGDFHGVVVSFNYPSKDYDKVVVIPQIVNGYIVQIIAEDCFADQELIPRVEIPESVMCIGNRAFYNNRGLSEVQVRGSEMRFIGDSAFEGCEKLWNFWCGNVYDMQYIGNWAFAGCVELQEFRSNMGEIHVNSIGEGAFSNCAQLRLVEVNTEWIGDFAFIGCQSLESFNFHRVRRIGVAAFAACYSLYIGELQNVEIIEVMAFYDCDLRWYGGIQEIFFDGWRIGFVGANAFAGSRANIYVRGRDEASTIDQWQLRWYDGGCEVHWEQ